MSVLLVHTICQSGQGFLQEQRESKEWTQLDRKPCSTPYSLCHKGFCSPTLYNLVRAWFLVTILNARGQNRIFNCEYAVLYWWLSAVYTVTTYTLHPSVSHPNSECQVALFSFSWSIPLFLWLWNDLEPSTLQDTIKATKSFHRLWHFWCPDYWRTVTYSQNQVPHSALFFIILLPENTSPNQWHWASFPPQVSN